MSNNIILKKSSVGDKVPAPSDLQYGELALNYNDGNLFYKNSSNSVVTIASNKFLSVTGNVTANNFIGNGSQITGLSTFTTITATGQSNVVANSSGLLNFAGSGIAISTDPDTGTVTFTNTSASSIFGTGGSMGTIVDPVTSSEDLGFIDDAVSQTFLLGGLIVDGIVVNDSIVNSTITGDKLASNININTNGNITSTANISGNYLIGNGVYITGLTGSQYGNANVALYLASGTNSSNIITTGNVTGTTFIGSGAGLTSIAGANVTGTVANATYATSAGSATTATTATSATSATTAGTVTGNAQANITSVGTLTSLSVSGNITNGNITTTNWIRGANVSTTGNVLVDGYISVAGNLYVGNVVASANLVVQDPLVYFTANAAYPYNFDIGFYSHFVGGAGNTYQHTGLVRDYTDNTWKLFSNVAAEPAGADIDFAGAVYDSLWTGAISATGNITGANVVTGGIVSATGNITGGNLNGTSISGTLITAAQTNITSVGTLSSLTVGNATSNVIFSNTGTVTSANLADAVGYKGVPQNSQTTAYTLALTDIGKHISITTGGVVIPANASVAFPIGSAIMVFNNSGSSQNISITTDTLRLAGTATTGTRTLAQYGIASLLKVTSTVWVVSGAGVT